MIEENPSTETSGTGRQRRRAVRRTGPPEQTTASVGATEIPALEAEVTTAEPEREVPDADRARASGGWLPIAGLAAAVIVLLALVGTTGWLVFEQRQANSRDEQRNEYIAVAKTTAKNLTSIHVDTAKDDVQRILDGATGEFKQEFDGRIDPFVSVVQEAKVNTDGQVLEAGLESETDDSANVLVAVRSMVTNAGAQQPQPRDFRLRVTVTEEDGQMMTSKVEFVA